MVSLQRMHSPSWLSFALILLVFSSLKSQVRPGVPATPCPIRNGQSIISGDLRLSPHSFKQNYCTSASLDWSSIDQSIVSDNQYSSVELNAGTKSSCLILGGFDLKIPAGSVIHGMSLELEGHVEKGPVITEKVQLINGLGQLIGENKANRNNSPAWPLTNGIDQIWTYGSPTDQWASSLNTDLLNDPGFAIVVQLANNQTSTAVAKLDQAKLIIRYTSVGRICMKECAMLFVDPVPGAEEYEWSYPLAAYPVSATDNEETISLNMEGLMPGVYEVCVAAKNSRGSSSKCCRSFLLSPCTSGSVGDYVWADENGNGLQESGEKGVPQITVGIYDALTKKLIRSVTTDSSGHFRFDGLNEGYYYLKYNLAANSYFTKVISSPTGFDVSKADESNGPGTSASFYLASGQFRDDIDAGIFSFSSIGDMVWSDDNGNGIQDLTENGISGIRLYLYNDQLILLDSTLSSNEGKYTFSKLFPGNYLIKTVLDSKYSVTQQHSGNNHERDNDFDKNGWTSQISLQYNYNNGSIDLGIQEVGAICGNIWYDSNKDGLRATNEKRYPGVKIYLLDDSKIVKLDSAYTNSEGKYCFPEIPIKNTRYLLIDLPKENIITFTDNGPDNIDSDFETTGFSKAQYFVYSAVLQIDGGLYYNCQLVASDLHVVGPSSFCIQAGERANLNAAPVTSNQYPSNYKLYYVLIDENGDVIETKDFPQFEIYSEGTFIISSIIVESDPNGFDFVDINSLTEGVNFENWVNGYLTKGICLKSSQNSARFSITPCATLSGRVWYDYGKDGIQDPQDRDMKDIQIYLTDSGSRVLDSVRTSPDGLYKFDHLVTNIIYRLQFNFPKDFVASPKDASGFEYNDSDIDGAGWSDLIPLTGKDSIVIDAGMSLNCTALAGTLQKLPLQKDCYSGNSLLIESSPANSAVIPAGFSIKYILTHGPNFIIEDYSNSPQFYVNQIGTFSIYALVLNENPTDYNYINLNSRIQKGTTTLVGFSSPLRSENICHAITSRSVNHFIYDCVNIEGLVWYDKNKDGSQANENGVLGTKVYLLRSNGTLLDSTATTGDGRYRFSSITPSIDYKIKILVDTPYIFTLQDATGSEADDSDVDQSGLSRVYSLIPGTTQQSDAGILFPCSVLAAPIEYRFQSNTCLRPSGVDLRSRVVGNHSYNNKFQVLYLLSNKETDVILQTSVIPDFRVYDSGMYEVWGLIIPNSSHPEYEDFSFLIQGKTKIDEIRSFLNKTNICHSWTPNTVSFNVMACDRIAGSIWEDQTKDGLHDSFEPFLEDIKIYLVNNQNTIIDSTLTNDKGSYAFINLVAADYFIRVSIPADFQMTLQNVGTNRSIDSDFSTQGELFVNSSEVQTGTFKDGGLIREYGQVGNLVWEDVNGNGIQEIGEPGINGVTLHLYQASTHEKIASTITSDMNGISGSYLFPYAPVGQTYIVAEMSSRYCVTLQGAGSNKLEDNNFKTHGQIHTSDTFNVIAQTQNSDVDLGIFRKSTVGNYVWLDQNQNGIQDSNESGINDVIVRLFEASGKKIGEIQTRYNPEFQTDGYFEFNDLKPGYYYLQFTNTLGLAFTQANAGTIDFDCDVTESNGPGTTDQFLINSGDIQLHHDAGFIPPGLIGDNIWMDNNLNGLQDPEESGASEITVELYNASMDKIKETKTNAFGEYHFPVEPGQYIIRVVLPEGLQFTKYNPSNDELNSDIMGTYGEGTSNMIELNKYGEHAIINAGLVQPSILALNEIELNAKRVKNSVLIEWKHEIKSVNGKFEIWKFNYQWMKLTEFSGNNIPYNQLQKFEDKDPVMHAESQYQIRYTYEGGQILSNIIVLPVSSNEIKIQNQLVSDNLTAIQTNTAPIQYIITDINGKTIHTGNLLRTEEVISINDIPSGFYFIRFNSEGNFLKAIPFVVVR